MSAFQKKKKVTSLFIGKKNNYGILNLWFKYLLGCLCIPGTSYKFRVLAVNVLGASPPSAPSKAYTVMGSNQTNPRPVDGPYITYSEAINETTIILKWTVSKLLNMPINMNYYCNF